MSFGDSDDERIVYSLSDGYSESEADQRAVTRIHERLNNVLKHHLRAACGKTLKLSSLNRAPRHDPTFAVFAVEGLETLPVDRLVSVLGEHFGALGSDWNFVSRRGIAADEYRDTIRVRRSKFRLRGDWPSLSSVLQWGLNLLVLLAVIGLYHNVHFASLLTAASAAVQSALG